jgi:hypothetical protein
MNIVTAGKDVPAPQPLSTPSAAMGSGLDPADRPGMTVCFIRMFFIRFAR